MPIRITSYTVYCDGGCLGHHHNGAKTKEDAWQDARKDGWVKIGRKYLCPFCNKQPKIKLKLHDGLIVVE